MQFGWRRILSRQRHFQLGIIVVALSDGFRLCGGDGSALEGLRILVGARGQLTERVGERERRNHRRTGTDARARAVPGIETRRLDAARRRLTGVARVHRVETGSGRWGRHETDAAAAGATHARRTCAALIAQSVEVAHRLHYDTPFH